MPRHTQHTNTDCLVKQHYDINVYITFIMLIFLRKIIEVKYYVINESTIAFLEVKLLNTAESIFNTQI